MDCCCKDPVNKKIAIEGTEVARHSCVAEKSIHFCLECELSARVCYTVTCCRLCCQVRLIQR